MLVVLRITFGPVGLGRIRTRCSMALHDTITRRTSKSLQTKGGSSLALFLIDILRLEGVCIDVLHTVDLGVGAHFVANVMVEVISDWGREKFARLNADLKT